MRHSAPETAKGLGVRLPMPSHPWRPNLKQGKFPCKTTLGVAAAASLALGALFAPVTASANYSHCDEQPEAVGCPGNYPGAPGTMGSYQQVSPKKPVHAHSRPAPTRNTPQKG
jgi:hypothetical protein